MPSRSQPSRPCSSLQTGHLQGASPVPIPKVRSIRPWCGCSVSELYCLSKRCRQTLFRWCRAGSGEVSVGGPAPVSIGKNVDILIWVVQSTVLNFRVTYNPICGTSLIYHDFLVVFSARPRARIPFARRYGVKFDVMCLNCKRGGYS